MTRAPADGCPLCLGPRVAEPYATTQRGRHLTALYRCPDCGHEWWTGWSLDGLEALEAKGGAA